MLAAPSSSEPVQKKSFSEGSGMEAAGLQMLDSTEDVTFLVTKEAKMATWEKLELKPTELASVYKTVALFRIKLVADSLWMRCWTRSAAEGLAFWYRTGSTHHVAHVRAWTGRGQWIEEFWAARCEQQQPQSQGRQECRRRSTR